MRRLSKRVARRLDALVSSLRADPLVKDVVVREKVVGITLGFMRYTVVLAGGRHVDACELYSIDDGVRRFRYEYVEEDGGGWKLRWDNAPHQPGIETSPRHLHHADGDVLPTHVQTMGDVLVEIASRGLAREG